MIHDRFSFLSRLEGLGPRWQAATRFLAQPSLVDLPDGRTDLIPGEVWAAVMRRPGRAATSSGGPPSESLSEDIAAAAASVLVERALGKKRRRKESAMECRVASRRERLCV